MVAAFVLYVIGGPDLEAVWAIQVPVLLVGGFLVAVGRPEHPIGWLLLVAGVIQALSILGLLLAGEIAGDASLWLEAVGNAFATMTVLVTPAVLLIFPSGALPTRRWRPLMWEVGLAALVRVGRPDHRRVGRGRDADEDESSGTPLRRARFCRRWLSTQL